MSRRISTHREYGDTYGQTLWQSFYEELPMTPLMRKPHSPDGPFSPSLRFTR